MRDYIDTVIRTFHVTGATRAARMPKRARFRGRRSTFVPLPLEALARAR